jgi:hypothetical protein
VLRKAGRYAGAFGDEAEHHIGKNGHWVPIFPEFRSHLEAAW